MHLGLGAVATTLSAVLDEIAAPLDGLDPRLSWRGDDLWVSLTVTAADLWLAVLVAMAAMTGTDYPAVRLEADPIGDPTVA